MAGGRKWVVPLWKAIWNYQVKLTMHTLHNSTVLLLGLLTREKLLLKEECTRIFISELFVNCYKAKKT